MPAATEGRDAPSSGAGRPAGALAAATPPVLPGVALPKGGGAVRGMGEKFAVNPVNGTGRITVPLPLTPGRGGFGPQLALEYDSGSGNGPFGLGWQLSLPSITRRTDRGIPRYDDARESDVFQISGAEDLVPVLRADGEVDERHRDGYAVRRYRPRVDTAFARIERWTRLDDTADVHWRSLSADNVLDRYGVDAESRVSDPDDPTRIFCWLLSETRDQSGNATRYSYKAEDATGVDVEAPNERQRGDRDSRSRSAERYLKSIRYGNVEPLLDERGHRPRLVADEQWDRTHWMFEAVLDYGEHHPDVPRPGDAGDWSVRTDPFSARRSGFEVRSYRLCRRVLMFHHFPDEPGIGADCLVRALELDHDHSAADEAAEVAAPGADLTMLRSATVSNYRRAAHGYDRADLPPVAFGYSRARIDPTIRLLDRTSLQDLPSGIDDRSYRWLDLHGEGVPGVLCEQGGEWYYTSNRGPLHGRPALGPATLIDTRPNVAMRDAQFLDVAGDGRADVVVTTTGAAGYYAHDEHDGWEEFRLFPAAPSDGLTAGDLRMLDLDGDGIPDLVRATSETIEWSPSLGVGGYGAVRTQVAGRTESDGPRVVFDDDEQSIYLADMTGDGLTDLVRVRNGDVVYWPNKGLGRYGHQVVMDHPPRLATTGPLDQSRVRLADIDGSGTSDLVYLRDDTAVLVFNRSGNSWSEPLTLPAFPHIDGLTSVDVLDLTGTGTASLVWSSPLPADERCPVRYVDLLSEGKPHLLTSMRNNVGLETEIYYVTSHRQYLRDQEAGCPWLSTLPFPVEVVDRVVTHDRIGRHEFVTRYAYHHPYFDRTEREFRGFAMVEQWDTGEISADGSRLTSTVPTHTKTWWHTGMPDDNGDLTEVFASLPAERPDAFYRPLGVTARGLVAQAAMSHAPSGLDPDERREAARALKGQMLRKEVYADDDTPAMAIPFSVTQSDWTVRCEQRRAGNRHAVFFVHPAAKLTVHCERRPDDVRAQHELTLEVDRYGRPGREVAVSYGRRDASDLTVPRDRTWQETSRITCTRTRHTNAIDDEDQWPDDYRLPSTSELRSWEVTGVAPLDGVRFTLAEWQHDGYAMTEPVTIGYHDVPPADGPSRRLIEHARTLYRPDDLGTGTADGLLALGALEPRALAGDLFKLSATREMVDDVLSRDGRPLVADQPALLAEAGYVDGRTVSGAGLFPAGEPAAWWVPTGRVFLSPDGADPPAAELGFAIRHFYLPHRLRTPFHTADRPAESVVSYDDYSLLTRGSIDAVGNRISAERHDYRTLTARRVVDPNGNRADTVVDVHGLVVATAMQGKSSEHVGDSLDRLDPDVTPEDVAAVLDDPATAAALLGRATTRYCHDLFAYARTQDEPQPTPTMVVTLARTVHDADLADGETTPVAITVSHADGFGREVQRRVLATADDPDDPGAARWAVSGWQVLDDKGRPVRRYEPFFSASARFEHGVRVGVATDAVYDPLDRVVATLHPDGSYAKTVTTPWTQTTWDRNDTVLLQPGDDPDVGGWVRRLLEHRDEPWRSWHDRRIGSERGVPAREAAERTVAHAGTPTMVHFDALGRPFLTEHDVGTAAAPRLVRTCLEIDLEGNQCAVFDGGGRSADRVVMRAMYDLLGRQLRQDSMDAGSRWTLHDVGGKPVRTWDERGHEIGTAYDRLRRPVASTLATEGRAGVVVTERMTYGEDLDDAAARNLRMRLHRRDDQSGSLVTLACDFKGNPTRSSRRVVGSADSEPVDWGADAELTDEEFDDAVAYDAMNRPIAATPPHSDRTDRCTTLTRYDLGGFVTGVDAALFGEDDPRTFVADIRYDAKGQRERVAYGNGVVTEFSYDPETFRVARIRSRRADGAVLQDLTYTFDPVGNVTHIADAATPSVFFRNQVVDAGHDYTYDAAYRLVTATGREHLGQTGDGPATGGPGRAVPQPGDGTALCRYRETYAYDDAGNITEVRHRRSDTAQPGWTRTFDHASTSRLDAGDHCNRLSASRIGDDVGEFTYDAHGNTVAMPTAAALDWDHKDQLVAVRASATTDRSSWMRYDGTGARVSKASGRPGRIRRQRLYLGGAEVDRVHRGRRRGLQRQTLQVSAGTERIAIVEQRNDVDDGTAKRVVRYQLTDHLGSSVVELDERARVIDLEEYAAYGWTTYLGVASERQTPKRYRFTGKERDVETGFDFVGARYFVPWLCRWLSCDPVGVGDGPNVYAYVAGNPVKMVDRTGHGKEQAVGLNDLILYADRVKNRLQVGLNVQKDHAISQDILKTILGPLERLYKPGRDLTVAVETGAATGNSSALWHTVKSGLEANVQSAVAALQAEGKGLSITKDVVAPMVQVIEQANGGALTGRQGTAILSQLANLHSTTSLEEAGKMLALLEAGDAVKVESFVSKLAKSTKGAAAWLGTLRSIATAENAAAVATQATALVAKAAPVLSKLAPVARVLDKFAGPLGIGIGVLQMATATNTEERIDGGITTVSSALMMSKHPVAIAAGGGLMAGQLIEKSLDVSKYASEAGITVYEGLRDAGLNDTASFVIGGIATVAVTPSAIGYAAAAKVSSWFD